MNIAYISFRLITYLPLVLFFTFLPWIANFFILALLPYSLIFCVDDLCKDAPKEVWNFVMLLNFLTTYSSVILWHWAGMRFLPKLLNKHSRKIILIILSVISMIFGFGVFSDYFFSWRYLLFLLVPVLAIVTVWLPRYKKKLLK